MTPTDGALAGRGVLTGRKVLAMVVGFFAVVLSANLAMAYLAIHSASGLTNADAFRDGLAYNRTLAAAEAQQALGWRSRIERHGDRLVVGVTDRDGTPLSGLAVSVRLLRPGHAPYERALSLEETSTGDYDSPLSLPWPGRWIAALQLSDGAGHVYRRDHELLVTP